jgi:hypothetical protein
MHTKFGLPNREIVLERPAEGYYIYRDLMGQTRMEIFRTEGGMMKIKPLSAHPWVLHYMFLDEVKLDITITPEKKPEATDAKVEERKSSRRTG